MDVVETTVATAVDMPARTSTGNGNDEPDPELQSGGTSAMLSGGAHMLRTRGVNGRFVSSYTDI